MKKEDLTRYIQDWQEGVKDSLDDLFPLLYDQLRNIARHHLSNDSSRTLQPTVLVNEVYCKLQNSSPDFPIHNRAQFFALAGRMMRQICVDYARNKNRLKRGGGYNIVTYTSQMGVEPNSQVDILVLNTALKELEGFDKRLARIVELLFFAGLTMAETGQVLDLSERTIKRDWRIAKAWLFKRINPAGTGS